MTFSQPRESAAERDGSAGLASALRRSRWIGAVPGLGADVARWDLAMAAERTALHTRQVEGLGPGRLPVRRLGRVALGTAVGQARWNIRQLAPAVLGPRGALTHPSRWIADGSADYLRDQLASLGPAAAELSRALEQGSGLVPDAIVRALRADPVRPRPMTHGEVARLVGERLGRRIRRIEHRPLSVTALGQLHRGVLDDGSDDGSPVLIQVLRPGIRAAVEADLQLVATVLPGLRAAVPALRRVELGDLLDQFARQLIQRSDLRHDVLDTIELGLAAEQLDVTGVRIARPVRGGFDQHVAVYEDRPGARPLDVAGDDLDARSAVAGLVGISLEAALFAGAFATDLRSEHLLVDHDGSLIQVGGAAAGHFDTEERRLLASYVVALLTADPQRQLESLVGLGAAPAGLDERSLIESLAQASALEPARVLTGGRRARGEAARALQTISRRHSLRLTPSMLLLARSGLGLRHLARTSAPEVSLPAALLPMLPKLHESIRRSQ